MMDYLVIYRIHGVLETESYRFSADDAEHAIEQFRSAEPDESMVVVAVILI